MMATRSKRARLALEHTLETRRKRASSFSVSIDQDSLEEILSKLPLKSLIRFRCVSREWHALTQNPSFITKQHLSCSSPNMYLFVDQYLLDIIDDEKKKGIYEFSMLDSKSKFTKLEFSFVNNRRLESIRCIASSNGLACFIALYKSENGSANEFERSIIICNPTTKQSRYLPIPNPPWKLPRMSYRPLLGFEFLHDIGEYKLVSIYLESVGNDELEGTFRAHVLTQSSNSWRRINHEFPFSTCYDDCFALSSLTCNGVFYWMVRRTRTDSLFILSFSLRDEAFMHSISLPSLRPGAAATYLHTMSPPFLQWGNKSLALLLPSGVGLVPHHVLWVMQTSDESSGKTPPPWTRQVRIRDSSLSTSMRFMGFSNDHQFWILRTPKGACVLYDPVRKKLKKIRKSEANKIYLQVIRAKQVQLIDKNPSKAISLFWAAMNAGDRVDSPPKDMALVMKQLDRAEEAIKSFRHLCPFESKESLNNVLDSWWSCTRGREGLKTRLKCFSPN